ATRTATATATTIPATTGITIRRPSTIPTRSTPPARSIPSSTACAAGSSWTLKRKGPVLRPGLFRFCPVLAGNDRATFIGGDMRLAAPPGGIPAFRDRRQGDPGAIHRLGLAGEIHMPHPAVAFREGDGLGGILGQDAGEDLMGGAVAIGHADMGAIQGVAL